MIKEHDCIVPTSDLSANSPVRRDLGTVVHTHPGQAAFEVAFANFTGETACRYGRNHLSKMRHRTNVRNCDHVAKVRLGLWDQE